MGLFLCLLYGLISGLTDFLPVSSLAHQALFLQICGYNTRLPLLDLCVHIGMLASVYYANRSVLSKLRRERQLRNSRRYQNNRGVSTAHYDVRLIKSATVPMLLVLLLYLVTNSNEFNPVPLSVFLVFNGAIMIIPEYLRHGNKDSRSMTALDGVFMGIISALSCLPGISRIGLGLSYTSMRGADRQHSINWAMLLSVPAVVMFIIFDFVNMATIGLGTISFAYIAGSVLATATAFIGTYLGIMGIRFLSDRAGFSGFAYYSWGAALFTFGLYLIT